MNNTKYKVQYIISFFLLTLLIFSYVFQIGSLSWEITEIKNLQEDINSYSRESQSLEYEFLQSNSFFEVENIAQELDYEKATIASYIEVLGSEVVVK